MVIVEVLIVAFESLDARVDSIENNLVVAGKMVYCNVDSCLGLKREKYELEGLGKLA